MLERSKLIRFRRLAFLAAAVLVLASAVSCNVAAQPSDSSAPVVKVQWNKTLRVVNPMSYGIDCPSCFDPAWTHNPALMKPLSILTDGGKPLIRLHDWGVLAPDGPEGWINRDGTWNAAKIANTLAPLIGAGYRLMIDIPAGPAGQRDPVHTDDMTRLAASLVKIVNVDNHFGVKYWELPNEREHMLHPDRMADMFLSAAAAMKKVDPSILVGGPATDSVNVIYISAFVKLVFPHIDFVTCHTYGGAGAQSDAASYARAIEAVNGVATLRESLSSVTHGKYLPIFVDEFNIGWKHTQNIYNNEGAVYFSIVQTGVVEAGGDVSNVWDVAPPLDMSIVAKDGHLYPSANLFTLMNKYFYGDEVAAQSTSPGVRAYAVRSSSQHSLLLTNLSDSPLRVVLEFSAWTTDAMHGFQISSDGYQDIGAVKFTNPQTVEISLPAYSVTALVR